MFVIACVSQTSDTVGYDDYVEGVEADEVTSLETPLSEVCCMYMDASLEITTSLNFRTEIARDRVVVALL